ncbi:hypothetical protein [Pseudoalteromonas sp. MMG022]|uniref:hypothetical protein n=1 Tax=Pseudoalteromonas sp. MMG022 TaxID=2909978 RepID=UPI001F32F41B|nr:hypothetical protein [Pseudoalteromonas sp. MMG022]MCF6435118.1 hypothetical protein [Pseudoalteromonas sp. MMG022]
MREKHLKPMAALLLLVGGILSLYRVAHASNGSLSEFHVLSCTKIKHENQRLLLHLGQIDTEAAHAMQQQVDKTLAQMNVAHKQAFRCTQLINQLKNKGQKVATNYVLVIADAPLTPPIQHTKNF